MSATTESRELFFGLIGAVGTDLTRVTEVLNDTLSEFGYQSHALRLAEILDEIDNLKPNLRSSPADDYIRTHMDAGDRLREVTGRQDALVVLAFSHLMATRLSNPTHRRSFIFRSIKNAGELERLRSVYGESFYAIAAYASHENRRQALSSRIAKSRGESPPEKFFASAEDLMWRDQSGPGKKMGQQVSRVFHQADVFVDTSDEQGLVDALKRFVLLIFGDTLNTPSKAEYCMFAAQAAALRSSELGRQVGACIASPEGDVISLGTNEVPKAGGGLYWPGDIPDKRQFKIGGDSNDEQKRGLVIDTLSRLQKAGWLVTEHKSKSGEQLADDALGSEDIFGKESRVANLIEFGRAVHGEMAALTDAARRGVRVEGSSMFVTTFPCHLCARHIVAAGIKTVMYIEPYPKSLTAELYPDSVEVEALENSKLVKFVPFVGVAPRQYLRLFEASERKHRLTGEVIKFNKQTAVPRYSKAEAAYIELEKSVFQTFLDEVRGN